jgi:two-component system, response regulator
MNHLPRILLVEDNLRDAELTLNALSAHHLANEVLHLRDGAEALEFLHRRGQFSGRRNGQPAVVLLDLKMPRVDGLEVLRQMRGNPALKMIPVVIMTSSREDRDLIDSYNLGVNAYIVKPVKFQNFVDAVNQIGAFWAVLNEPPPGSIPRANRPRQ